MNILVTGGTKGIGRAVAERFAAPGVKVFVAYARDDAAAEATAAAIAERGGEPFRVKCDVGDADSRRLLMAEIARQTSTLEQIVHCAVSSPWGPLLEVSAEETLRSVMVNGLAPLEVVRAATALLARGSTVMVISRRGSSMVIPGYGPIGIAKALVESAMRYLAVELAPKGIRTHVIEVTAVLTDTYRSIVPDAEERMAELGAASPAGRGVTTADIADAVQWLASERAEMLTGRTVVLDGAANLLV